MYRIGGQDFGKRVGGGCLEGGGDNEKQSFRGPLSNSLSVTNIYPVLS